MKSNYKVNTEDAATTAVAPEAEAVKLGLQEMEERKKRKAKFDKETRRLEKEQQKKDMYDDAFGVD